MTDRQARARSRRELPPPPLGFRRSGSLAEPLKLGASSCRARRLGFHESSFFVLVDGRSSHAGGMGDLRRGCSSSRRPSRSRSRGPSTWVEHRLPRIRFGGALSSARAPFRKPSCRKRRSRLQRPRVWMSPRRDPLDVCALGTSASGAGCPDSRALPRVRPPRDACSLREEIFEAPRGARLRRTPSSRKRLAHFCMPRNEPRWA